MVKPRLPLVLCVSLIAVSAAFAQSSYVFQLPGQTGLSTQIVGSGDDDFHRIVINQNGPSKASRIVATPNGAKFYILAPGGTYSANASLGSINPVSAIAAGATKADVSPDGKLLWVVADHLYFLNTTSDALAADADTGVPVGATAVGVAISHDAKTAWVLSNTNAGSTITPINLTTFQSAGTPLNLTASASSIVLSSRNLLYVGTTDRLYEIDPLSLTVTSGGPIQLPSAAGPLQFTPDGKSAYFLNANPCSSCSPLFKLNVDTHTVSGWVPSDNSAPPSIDHILVAGNNRIFAYSSLTLKLWDVNPAPLSMSPTVLGLLPTSSVVAAAVSNERPSSRYLYLLIADHNFYRVSLANNGIDGTSSLDPANGIILSFVPIPAQSGAATLYQINPSQSVLPGASTALIAQVLDAAGRPVMGAPVSFSTDPATGITIDTSSSVTTAGGWAQTAITAPLTSGTYTVKLTSGSLSADFQVVVGSGGPGGGASQISIYSGDGQLLRQNESTLETQQPLTVKITDADGNPLQGVAVSFGVSEGIGTVVTSDTTTD